MTNFAARAVALLPLDERPVNTGLVKEIAQIAGFECNIPNADLLPSFRVPGNTSAFSSWLVDQGRSASALVVSVDTLVYGGLIPARTTDDTVEDSVWKLHVLRKIHETNPEVPIFAVSLVTRASDSYSNVEEPEYWSEYGRELHKLGKDAHRAWEERTELPQDSIPQEVREDFAKRRLRNHVVNLSALQMRWDGVLNYLALTADDTAEFSAGSVEQRWFEYWKELGAPSLPVIGYPGADETGAVLMARAVSTSCGFSPKVLVLTGDWDRLNLIPPYENGPIRGSISRQISAAGGIEVLEGEADVALVIHGPDPERRDHGSPQIPASDPDQIASTVRTVQRALSLNIPVALADVRFANGGDEALVQALSDAGLLTKLAAYGGWNTAGNALGGVVATAVAIAVGTKEETLDSRAQQIALRRRLLDDVAYQGVLRRDLMKTVFEGSYGPVSAEALEQAAEYTLEGMRRRLDSWNLSEGFEVASVEFPWNRSFEVDISFA